MMKIIGKLTIGGGEEAAPAPSMPSGTEMRNYLGAALLAAVPCLTAAMFFFGHRILLMLAAAFCAGTAVEIAFAVLRGRPLRGGSLAFAALLVLVLPPAIPLWMVAAGSAFGVFFGKEVFGGTGHHVFCPVLIGKGFLMFSYPQVVKGSYFGSMLEHEPGAWIVCAVITLLGGVEMVLACRSNWRVLSGILLSALCLTVSMQMSGKLPYDSAIKLIAADGFLLGACFLACDPACSPRDGNGKRLYGLLIGSVAVLMRCFSNYSEAMLSAILIGNLFAPTINAVTGVDAERRAAREEQ